MIASSTISRGAPESVAIDGTPLAAASMSTRPKPFGGARREDEHVGGAVVVGEVGVGDEAHEVHVAQAVAIDAPLDLVALRPAPADHDVQ